jgi:hypothetical protein
MNSFRITGLEPETFAAYFGKSDGERAILLNAKRGCFQARVRRA